MLSVSFLLTNSERVNVVKQLMYQYGLRLNNHLTKNREMNFLWLCNWNLRLVWNKRLNVDTANCYVNAYILSRIKEFTVKESIILGYKAC